MMPANAERFLQRSVNDGSDSDMTEGWAFPMIRDILEVNYGKGLKKAKRMSDSISVYGSNGVVGEHNEALTHGPTIIVGRKGTVGAINFSDVPCWPIDTTYFIDEFNDLDPNYIVYALKGLNLAELDTSTAIPGLNRDDLYGQHVPLAPLAEQKRIVAKVEELLARVNAARERLANVQEILKRFRQSVLAEAITGNLTAEWREKNADKFDAKKELSVILDKKKQILKSQIIRNSKTEPTVGHGIILDDLPISWAFTNIDRLFLVIDYRGKTPKKSSDGKRLISAKNIKMGHLSDDPVEFVTEETYKNWMTRGFPRKGDIFFVTEGATMGYVAINTREDEFALAQRTLTLQPFSNMDTSLFMYFLMSRAFQDLIRANATGSAAVGIKGAKFRDLVIPFPPKEEQLEIVRRVEALLKVADTIEQRVETTTTQAEKLTQSILAKAFRGELVPTEAELARREARSYEPASALLAKIKAQSRINKFQRKREKSK